MISEHNKEKSVILSEKKVIQNFDACKHLSDAVSRYKEFTVKGNEVIVSFELPYHDVTAQKYIFKSPQSCIHTFYAISIQYLKN